MKLNAEVDFAVEYHEARTNEEKARRKRIIDSKLKPKGFLPPETFTR